MDLIVILVVSISSPWWRLISSDPLIALLIAVLTVILWLTLMGKRDQKTVLILWLFLAMMILVSSRLLTLDHLGYQAWKENLVRFIDPNYYFFANHPNERVGIVEVDRFFFFWWPFFIVGLLELSKNPRFRQLLIASLVITTLLISSKLPEAVLMFPLISVSIVMGLKMCVRAMKIYVKT